MAVVVITGSNSGFGLEGALAFARNGDTVYASMRDPAKAGRLQAAAMEEHLSIHICKLDITQPGTFDAFLKGIVDEAGSVDVLVNNAGMIRPGALEDIPEAALRLVMETNFFGPMLLTRAVLPHMRAQSGGHIIMVSSLSGLAGLPGDLPYAASKFALEGATEALRHEVDRWGIRLALVEAGMYSTGIFDPYMSEKILLPDDYPEDSPYRPLVENRLNEVHSRRSEAFHPRIVGELFVTIAQSDGTQLRWPADPVATKVLKTMLGHDDTGRDEFLRMVAGTAWWSEEEIMQTKLAHVCIEASDLDATEAFYRVLGLKRRFDFRNLQGELVGFYLAFGNNTFIEVVKTTKPKPGGIIKHFAIEVDDIDSTYEQLKSGGIDVTEKELAKDHQWMVTCTDPNGIFIELQQYTPQSMQLVGGVCEVDYQP